MNAEEPRFYISHLFSNLLLHYSAILSSSQVYIQLASHNNVLNVKSLLSVSRILFTRLGIFLHVANVIMMSLQYFVFRLIY